MNKSCKRQDFLYDEYSFNALETVSVVLLAIGVVLFLSLLFYRSLFAMIFLSPIGILVWKAQKKKKADKRKKELVIQFKDCIRSVGANLKAGYSVENAFKESLSDIKLLYGEQSHMAQELVYMIQGINNNISLEKLLLSLGRRSGIADIREFAEVFAIAKRSGGNMTDILVRTADVMGRKLDIDSEIQILISAKKLEQQIMNIVPFAIIIYISITSPGFFGVLYHNALGVIIMSLCLLVYLLAYRISTNIISINVN